MRLSNTGLESNKIQNLNETYPAQDLLMQTNQIVQYAAGIYGYNNVPLKVKENIEKVIKTVLNKYGCIEISLPTLQPENIWQESGRWDKYIEEGTMMTIETEKGKFGMAPTAEEAVSVFVRNKVKSYKSLPITLYQIGEKFRNEIRPRGFLMRGKSFPMMDAYSFNLNEEDLVKSYENMRNAYIEIFERLGLEVLPVAADSGAIGGKKSEEFMLISELGEDTILVDKKTGKAVNTEILEREDHKEYLKEEYGIEDVSALEEKRAIELGHIFQLGTKYSESMGVNYTNGEGKDALFYMGCYGIGVSRTLATIYENSAVEGKDGKVSGITLPINVAPYLLQIIPKIENEEKMAEAEKLYSDLNELEIGAIIDDRAKATFGAKMKDCKVLGTPYMAVIGDKVEAGHAEVENIATGEKHVMKQSELVEKLGTLKELVRQGVFKKLEEV